jgi:hypothetical protein
MLSLNNGRDSLNRYKVMLVPDLLFWRFRFNESKLSFLANSEFVFRHRCYSWLNAQLTATVKFSSHKNRSSLQDQYFV